MDAKEAKSRAQYLADTVHMPFTVLNLKKEPGFFYIYTAKRVSSSPEQFEKDWNILDTIYPSGSNGGRDESIRIGIKREKRVEFIRAETA